MANNFNNSNDINKFLNQNETHRSTGRQQDQQQYSQYRQTQYQQQTGTQKKKSGFPKGLLILILIAGLVVGGIWGIPKMTAAYAQRQLELQRQQIAEALEKGDQQAAEGNISAAITAYKEAGEEGQEKIRQLYLSEARELVEDGKFAKAVTYLKERPGGVFSDAEACQETVRLAREHNEEILAEAKRVITEENGSAANIWLTESYMAKFEDWAQTMVPEETPGYEELRSELKISRGYVYIVSGNFYPELETLDDLWKDAGKGSMEEKILSAIEKITDARLSGIDELREISRNESFIHNVTAKHLPDMYHFDTTDMDEYLRYYAVSREVHYQTIKPAASLTDSYRNREAIRIGIDYHGPSMELTEKNLSDLKTLCGTQSDGKILILHSRQKFKDSDGTLFICTELMDYLPAEYIPQSLAEAEYVILLESTYASRGVYQNGCVRILETTKITLYNTVTGKSLYTAKEQGELSDTMYYTGSVPSHYSAGSPRMDEHLLEITSLIR